MANSTLHFFLAASLCLFSQGLLAKDVNVSTVSGEPAICQAFETELKSLYALMPFELPGLERVRSAADAKPVKLPTVPRAIVREPIAIDFNNDGQLDQVFKYDDGGSYITGTILYVLLGVSSDELPKEASSLDNFLIFPCQFDRSQPAATDCPTVSQNADEAGIPFGPVFFRGRYTDIQLLRYNGETFLRLRSTSAETKQFAAIVKPVGQKGFEPVCLFERSK